MALLHQALQRSTAHPGRQMARAAIVIGLKCDITSLNGNDVIIPVWWHQSCEKECKKLPLSVREATFWTVPFSWLASGVQELRWSDLIKPLMRLLMNPHTMMMLLVFNAARHFPSPSWAVGPFLAHQDWWCMNEHKPDRCVTQGAARRLSFVHQQNKCYKTGRLYSDILLSFVWIYIFFWGGGGSYSVNTTLICSLLWWLQRLKYSRHECFKTPPAGQYYPNMKLEPNLQIASRKSIISFLMPIKREKINKL